MRVSLTNVTNVETSSCHIFYSDQYYLYQSLDVVLRVDCEAIWEDECWHNVSIASEHINHPDVN